MSTFIEAADFAIEYNPDMIIGLGGGSVMDVAKGVAIQIENPDLDLEDLSPFATLSRRKAKLVTVPTTCGTGAEVSWALVPSDPKEKRKIELAHASAVPDIVILDPSFLSTAPPHVLAATCFDALANAVESFLCEWSNQFTEFWSIGALRRIISAAPALIRDPTDIAAGNEMFHASLLGGLAFSSSQVGLPHAIAHGIGAIFKTGHGDSVASVLPEILEFYLADSSAEIRLAHLHLALDETNPSALGLIHLIEGLRFDLNLPDSISKLRISEKDFKGSLDLLIERINESTCTALSPRVPSIDELRELLSELF